MDTDSTEEQVSEESAVSNDVSEETTSEESTVTDEESSNASPELSKISLEDLPKEAQALAEQRLKEMEVAFTKDRQSLGELNKKAELYDQLQQQELLKQKFPVKQEEANDETTSLLAEALGVDVNSLEGEQRQQLEQLAKIVDFAAKKRVQESIQPLQHDLMQRDYKQELETVKKKYSDFDAYTQQIQTIIAKNPQIGYEQAYKLAAWEDQSVKGRTEAMKNLVVKKKQTQPKSTASANSDDTPQGFENIFKWAKNKVGS